MGLWRDWQGLARRAPYDRSSAGLGWSNRKKGRASAPPFRRTALRFGRPVLHPFPCYSFGHRPFLVAADEAHSKHTTPYTPGGRGCQEFRHGTVLAFSRARPYAEQGYAPHVYVLYPYASLAYIWDTSIYTDRLSAGDGDRVGRRSGYLSCPMLQTSGARQ